jgi:hypothetical protein
METHLNIATKNLYDVFKKYTIEGNLRDRSCDCCVTDTEIKELLSKDLRTLTEDEIGHFMRSGITTYGEIADYKHFLPRILELMQFDGSNIADDFTTFEKLNYANLGSLATSFSVEIFFLLKIKDEDLGKNNYTS